jgi:hypothetical protein
LTTNFIFTSEVYSKIEAEIHVECDVKKAAILRISRARARVKGFGCEKRRIAIVEVRTMIQSAGLRDAPMGRLRLRQINEPRALRQQIR